MPPGHLQRRKFNHDEARSRYQAGESATALARVYNVSWQSIMFAVDDDFRARKRARDTQAKRRERKTRPVSPPCHCVSDTCSRCRERAAKSRYYTNHRDEVLETKRLYRLRNVERSREYDRSRKKVVDPLKRIARSTVHYALRTGALSRQPCEICGATQVDAHHDDYAKPLDIRWLCRIHHGKLHRQPRVPT